MKEVVSALTLELSVLRGAMFIADAHPHNVGLGFLFLIIFSVAGLIMVRDHFSQVDTYG